MSFNFLDKAPCRDADPWLFDQSEIHLAMPALNYCRSCIFWKECDEWVSPKRNYYEGVVAGKVWRNGRILAKLDSSSPHRLVVGEEPEDEIASTIRGSELPRDRYGDVLPGGQGRIFGGELHGEENL